MSLGRYRNLNTLTDDFGRQYVETSDFPSKDVLNTFDTVQIVASKFDRLDILAHKHLGNSDYWFIIAIFNDIDYAYNFEEGQILLIPTNLDAVLKLF